MRNSLQFLLQPRTACLFLILAIGSVVSAQEAAQAPRWELLTMNGSKPNLSATGEGITSYKFDQLFNRGKSSVTLVDPAKLPFKVELPVGYTLYNNLVYGIETEVMRRCLRDTSQNSRCWRMEYLFAPTMRLTMVRLKNVFGLPR